MSKVVDNKIQANSLADNKIKAIPEVGDVWEISYYGVMKKAYICNTKDYKHPLCVLEDGETFLLSDVQERNISANPK